MAENKIELKSVNDLLGMKFFIPSYQRGYRWTEQQVRDLLNDVNEFKPEKDKDSEEMTWYCLQPLVVAQMKSKRKAECGLADGEDWFEVVDGQQRLTTIFIILNLLEPETTLTLKYQTRPGSEQFLEKIKDNQDDSNIDYHFMIEAKKTIDGWPEKKLGDKPGDKLDVAKKLKENCKVIWYETTDDAYEVFKRLNSGKISLSNAELVKALLLKDDNFVGLDRDALKLKQLEMAGEWDRMEQTLHDDSFWYFINPEPEDARFNCTRIDFLLELILRCAKSEEGLFLYDVDSELKRNDYFIFSKYSEIIQKVGYSEPWKLIQRYFRTIKSWYDDREKYHYIGYLMNQKGDNKKNTLKDLLCESTKQKDEFLKTIKEECRKTVGIKPEQKKVICTNWIYPRDNDKIHNILLLFNLATTQNQISEMSRYPFDKHFQAARAKWSLEHIHAQKEKKVVWDKDSFDKIKGHLRQITVNGIDDLNAYIKDIETSEGIDDDTYKAIISAFMGKEVKKTEKEGGIISFLSDFEKDDHLTNMALLQGDKNAAFNNKTYPEKREKLAEYENVESESLFVPICTRNVFFKHYSPNSTNPLIWDEKAGLEYVTAMMKVVAAYIELGVIVPSNNNREYGLKTKENSK